MGFYLGLRVNAKTYKVILSQTRTRTRARTHAHTHTHHGHFTCDSSVISVLYETLYGFFFYKIVKKKGWERKKKVKRLEEIEVTVRKWSVQWSQVKLKD